MTHLSGFLRWMLVVSVIAGGFSATARAGDEEPVAVVSANRININLGAHRAQIPYGRTHALNESNAAIRRIVIVIHGSDRKADLQLTGMSEAAAAAGADGSTMILAPHFLIEADIAAHDLGDQVLFWSLNGWKYGATSLSTAAHPRPARITSYAVIDRLITYVADRRRFPGLRKIILCGHSAGGQFVGRYAMTNRIHQQIREKRIRLLYVVANPSSYAYLNSTRGVSGDWVRFETPSARGCQHFDSWPYGLKNLEGYAEGLPRHTIRAQFSRRPIRFLLGEEDTAARGGGVSTSCAARLQGPTRLTRGLRYYKHLGDVYGPSIYAWHRLETIPNVGHSSRAVWTSPEGRKHIFDQTVPLRSHLANFGQASSLGPRPLTFRWLGLPEATSYEVVVRSKGGKVLHVENVSPAEVHGEGGGVCIYLPRVSVPPQSVWVASARLPAGKHVSTLPQSIRQRSR